MGLFSPIKNSSNDSLFLEGTNAIKTDIRFDVLNLTHSGDLHKSEQIDITDCVGSEILINSIYIKNSDDTISRVDIDRKVQFQPDLFANNSEIGKVWLDREFIGVNHPVLIVVDKEGGLMKIINPTNLVLGVDFSIERVKYKAKLSEKPVATKEVKSFNVLSLDSNNRKLRIGFGKNKGKWFFRIDLWYKGIRINQV